VEFFITWSLALGLLVVPGLTNYFVNRYYSPPGTSMASTLELVAASLTLTFGVVTACIVIVLGLSISWNDLHREVEAFFNLGLVGYGRDRPVSFPGMLAAWSLGEMALLALLGAFRLPSRFVR
jgi:hypothetical protein